MPISISVLPSSIDFVARFACDQVCVPIECPCAATCLRISGCHIACLPIGKNVALRQWDASAANPAGVLPGQGPSSKVSTTSPGLRKSWVLKCSKPKPGPPVVSICTVRDIPSAFGLPGQERKACPTVAEASGGAPGLCVSAAATPAGVAIAPELKEALGAKG